MLGAGVTAMRDQGPGGRWGRCGFSLGLGILRIGLSCVTVTSREFSIPSVEAIVPEELLTRIDLMFGDESNPQLPPHFCWLHQLEVWMKRVVDVPPYTVDSWEGIKDILLVLVVCL
jgi:hypothetical protein